MERSRRILFLLLINLGLAFVSLYILDFLQVIDYRQVISKVPFMQESPSARIEDPYLLEKVELEKKWEVLNEKVKNLEEAQVALEQDRKKLELEKEEIENKRLEVENLLAQWEQSKQDKSTYEKRVNEIAVNIVNMPPEKSVAILSELDDLLIIDILRKIDANAVTANSQSLSPYLLSLMDREQAARITLKMSQ